MHDIQVVSVTEINELVRLAIEREPFFNSVWVAGEITAATHARSGHIYFTISDGISKMRVVAWRHMATRIASAIEPGAHVTVNGRLTLYVPNGEYQLVAEFADTSGLGGMALEYARLRAKLEAEGLFDLERKRPLPEFPRVIGVVTSPTGAVLHDIQTVLRRRFPLAHLLLAPAQVQGAGSVESVRHALDLLIADGRAQVIIVARGGGSPEDLAAFNDEGLARQVFASPIPVVSAIGHETDFSLLDDVADLRAPTPTAAAELATPDVADFAFDVVSAVERTRRQVLHIIARKQNDLDALQQRLDRMAPHTNLDRHRAACIDLRRRLDGGMRVRLMMEQSRLDLHRAELHGLGGRVRDRLQEDIARKRLLLASPVVRVLVGGKSSVAAARTALDRSMETHLHERSASLASLRSQLRALDPTAVLDRGFAVLQAADGGELASIQQTATGEPIRAILRDGTIDATVTRVNKRPIGR